MTLKEIADKYGYGKPIEIGTDIYTAVIIPIEDSSIWMELVAMFDYDTCEPVLIGMHTGSDYYVIDYFDEPTKEVTSPTKEVVCTCQDLLKGHLPECDYIKARTA